MRHFNRFVILLIAFLFTGLKASANDWSDWFAMSDVTFNASTRTMKWKVVMYDDIGYDEMWRSDHGGMTIKVSKDNGSTWVTLGSVSCNSDGDDRKLSVASGAPGSLWGSDYGGSNRKYMYVNWTVPHEYLNCKLKFNMSGTWHYNGPGSNIGVNVTQEQTCSYQFSVSQINWDTSKNRIDVRPNGDVYAYYYLTGSGNSDALAHVVAYTGTNQSNMSWNGVGRITVGDKRENNISFGIDKISGASLKKGFYIRLQYEYWHKTTNNFYGTKTEDFYFPGYPYPSNLSARFDQTSKKVELHWNSNNTGHDQLGYWMVYRDGKFLTRLSESTTSYVDDGMSYEKDVQYTVRWSRQDYAYQTTNYFKGLETSSTVNTSRNVPIEGLNVNSLSDRITIDWNTSSYPSGWGHHFKIFVDDKEVGDLKPSADGQTSFNWQHINKYATIGEVTNYKTDDLDACGPHDYRIEGWVDNVKRSERAIEDQAIGNGVRFTKFSISKGSYEGKVRVSVNVSKISGTSDANLITIERRVAESSDNFVEMYRIQNGSNTVVWDDEEVKPGVYYEYRVSCATECTNGNNPLTAKNDIGFAQSMGTVAGQIAFGSGTAVEGVDVTLTPSGDANEANRQKHSLYLTDQDASCTWQFEGSDYVNEAFVDNDFTLQAWLWPSQVPTSSSTAYTIMDLGNSALMFNGEGLVWKTGNNSVYFRDDDMKLPEHHYSQVTLVRSGANYTAYVINYMDDTLHVGQ